MKIRFLGATQRVTGSNYLVEAAGKKFLVDCGLNQGSMEDELFNDLPFAYDVNEIDFMLLTHAHIDHSGRIPKLYKEGFRAPIYATKATCDLCEIMLPDSGYIQETENEIKNKKRRRLGKKATLEPLYTAEDARKSIEVFKPISYDEIIDVAPGIQVRFNDAGHMLGSAIIEVWVTEDGKMQKIVFSGDLGNNDIPLLAQPTMIADADYLVMESTYGNRLHIKNDQKASLFLDIVYETLAKGGTVVIPSFAVGRTQEILYELNKLREQHLDDEEFQRKYRMLMEVPVYVDSPLAVNATEVFKKNMNLFSDDIKEEIQKGDNPLDFDGLRFTRSVEDSKALNESTDPCIIISASGMCDVGRIKHHLKHHLWNYLDTILFVGYQAPGTLGRRIVDGEREVKVLGEDISVEARVEYIEGYSGHADQEGLLNFVYSFKNKRPKKIFLVHGENEPQNVLKDKILSTMDGVDVCIPKFGEAYELDGIEDGCIDCIDNPMDKQISRIELIEKMQALEKELVDMENQLKFNIDDSLSSDDGINKLNARVNDLRMQIIELMNGE